MGNSISIDDITTYESKATIYYTRFAQQIWSGYL